MRSLIVGVIAVSLVASSAWADTTDSSLSLFSTRPSRDPWHVNWLSGRDVGAPIVPVRPLAFPAILLEQDDAQPLHPAAVEHSDAYQTRAKIHKYASFAMLPLFAAEIALGQSLYNPPVNVNTPANPGWKRGAHAVVGVGIVGLFGVDTLTGAWNLFGEGWRDTDGRTLRLVHGLLMMAADVGFLASTASGPNSGGRRGAITFETNKVTHRNIAIASVSVATAGYLLMLFQK